MIRAESNYKSGIVVQRTEVTPNMTLSNQFDAILMLTWSDWKTEPRSNRYHYATRFARALPVLFIQHRYEDLSRIRIEESEIKNLDIVHVTCGLNEQQVEDILALLAARGIKRPMFWIYDSMNYQRLIDSCPRAYRVYHATEDYLTETNAWNLDTKEIKDAVVRLLSQVDYMVACTEGVADSCLTKGGYKGPYVVIENGCDTEFFIDISERCRAAKNSKRPIAIFQGGVNQRLDYDLLIDLATEMTDWDFHFCGISVHSEKWRQLKLLDNVKYHGAMQPERVGELMCQATVGIIPFIQDQWIRNSWPLKAYEYVACDLPVISVPITALEREPELFSIATTLEGFALAIREAAKTRHDAVRAAQRRESALANSYNRRFGTMVQRLMEASTRAIGSKKRNPIAILYDGMTSMHVSTIREHLEAFEKYSRHDITYIPATPGYWQRSSEALSALVDLSIFDAIIIHYSVRLSVPDHLDEGIAHAIERFHGLKMLFLQDEYESVETCRCWMERLKIDVVYTCVPSRGVADVYPSYRFPSTEFLPTLTGYVPEDPAIEQHAIPLAKRKIMIAYRGRQLPPIYGELGYEKYRIGVGMKAIASEREMCVDIEVDDSRRIYGTDWYKFLGSARATLGTESGSNIFDFDGSLKRKIDRLVRKNPGIPQRELAAHVLAPHEGRIRMNQVSPKIFEAIRLRTALVLFEGEYSGVVRPNEHFIPLRKDLANAGEVLDRLKDDFVIQELTERAYRDVVASDKYSYRRFVEAIDRDIDQRSYSRALSGRLMGPMLMVGVDGSIREVLPALPAGVWRGAHPLGKPMSLSEIVGGNFESQKVTCAATRNSLNKRTDILSMTGFRTTRWMWHRTPIILKERILGVARIALWKVRATANSGILYQTARRAWRLLPRNTRIRLARLLERS